MMSLMPPDRFRDPGVAQPGIDRSVRHANHASGDALWPDPVFMGLRRLMQLGPIGAVLSLFDRWIEAREDRLPHQAIDNARHFNLESRTSGPLANSSGDADPERPLAA